MSRRHAAVKRKINPDPKYHNLVLAKFINNLIEDGKKSVAEAITYGALENIRLKTKEDPVKVFLDAVNNVKPAIEVRSRRVGGATYQVPVEVKDYRGLALSIRWIISSARDRKERTMRAKLAAELLDAYNNKGGAVTKRENTHKMAEANKAFSHFRW